MEDNEIKSKYAAGENLYDEEGIPLKDSEYGSPDQVIGIEVQDYPPTLIITISKDCQCGCIEAKD